VSRRGKRAGGRNHTELERGGGKKHGCRLDGLTKTSDDPTLILNFKIFCEANKQEIEIVTV